MHTEVVTGQRCRDIASKWGRCTYTHIHKTVWNVTGNCVTMNIHKGRSNRYIGIASLWSTWLRKPNFTFPQPFLKTESEAWEEKPEEYSHFMGIVFHIPSPAKPALLLSSDQLCSHREPLELLKRPQVTSNLTMPKLSKSIITAPGRFCKVQTKTPVEFLAGKQGISFSSRAQISYF